MCDISIHTNNERSHYYRIIIHPLFSFLHTWKSAMLAPPLISFGSTMYSACATCPTTSCGKQCVSSFNPNNTGGWLVSWRKTDPNLSNQLKCHSAIRITTSPLYSCRVINRGTNPEPQKKSPGKENPKPQFLWTVP